MAFNGGRPRDKARPARLGTTTTAGLVDTAHPNACMSLLPLVEDATSWTHTVAAPRKPKWGVARARVSIVMGKCGATDSKNA